jgi:CheY-like chemotaxis protein
LLAAPGRRSEIARTRHELSACHGSHLAWGCKAIGLEESWATKHVEVDFAAQLISGHGRELSGDVAACPSRSRRPDGGWPRPARSGPVPAAPGTWESCPGPSPDTGSIADATSGAHRDPGDMPTWANPPADCCLSVRIMIIDDHEISRAACRALLHTEGFDVVADLPASDHPVRAARVLRPDVAIIDVIPTANTGFAFADAPHALAAPPAIILTSSTDRTVFGPGLKSYRFIRDPELASSVNGLRDRYERLAPCDMP